MTDWPPSPGSVIRGVKGLSTFSGHRGLLGVPLDLLLRFALIAGPNHVLTRRLGLLWALGICCAPLPDKDTSDVFAVQDPGHPKSPDWGDAADVASGLAGIAPAERHIRLRRSRRSP